MSGITIEQVSEVDAVALWLHARYETDARYETACVHSGWRADATELLALLDIDPTGQRLLDFRKVTTPSLEALARGVQAELARRRG